MMNKKEFNQFVEEWIEDINNLSPSQVRQLRKDLDNMPSNDYKLPDGFELVLPNSFNYETEAKKYSISTNTKYCYDSNNKFLDSRATNYQPRNYSVMNKVGRASIIKPAA